jgi:hypothetical protein
MSTTTEPRDSTEFDHDVVIVGGGPAGCSAGVFCAREGLDTLIFDRGRSSISRCAYLENYLGFPNGIDIESFYGLMHDHAERAGCTVVPDLVEVVVRREGGGFVIETQENRRMSARQVVAATRYDGEYLRPLDDDGTMFESYEHDGETHEHFAQSYPEDDGTTPVEGLYVASPSEKADKQAIMAAGWGARVAHRAIADARLAEGWWESAADGVDWVRRKAELDEEWAKRGTWVEWFDEYHAEDTPVEPDSERFERVRDASIDGSLSSYVTPEEIDSRTTAGHEALANQLDSKAIIAAVGEKALLESIDDEAIREYLDRVEARSEAR